MSGRTLCLDISKASLFISHGLPQFTLSPVPPGSACPTESLCGTWSQEFRHRGVPVWGRECCAHSPRLLPLRQPRTGSTWQQQEGQGPPGRLDRREKERAISLDWNKIGT